jgi:hypothetical protein
MTYSVKSVKTFEGMEGYGFNCSLYRGKRKVAFVIDEGNGGCLLIRWLDMDAPKVTHTVTWAGKDREVKMTPEEKVLREHCESLPEYEFSGKTFGMTMDILINDLVNRHLEDKELRRHCKKEILYRLKGDKPGTWRVRQVPYTPEVALPIRLIHDENLEEIANERFA